MFYIFIILILLILAFLIIGNYFYNYSLNSKKDKSHIFEHNESGDGFSDNDEYAKWFKENKTTLNMESVTGVNLVGYEFINENSNLWAIVVHGYTSKGEDMSLFAKKFYDMGFNVLVPDLLGHGKSGGNTISMGGIDSKDLIKWTDKISIKNDDTKILLFGVSMGAATVLNSLGKNPVNNVVAFIEDSGYVVLDELFSYQLKKMYNIPKILVIPASSFITSIRGKYKFSDVDATEGIKNTNLPGLILHGGKDDFVPVENAYLVYDLLNSNKEIKIFKDAIHVEAGFNEDDEYWNVVEDFVNKYVKKVSV